MDGRPDRRFIVAEEDVEGGLSCMNPTGSGLHGHHRLQGPATPEREPHTNNYVGRGSGYNLTLKASAFPKMFPGAGACQSTGNGSTLPIQTCVPTR